MLSAFLKVIHCISSSSFYFPQNTSSESDHNWSSAKSSKVSQTAPLVVPINIFRAVWTHSWFRLKVFFFITASSFPPDGQINSWISVFILWREDDETKFCMSENQVVPNFLQRSSFMLGVEWVLWSGLWWFGPTVVENRNCRLSFTAWLDETRIRTTWNVPSSRGYTDTWSANNYASIVLLTQVAQMEFAFLWFVALYYILSWKGG